ncbi:lipopolysaccharide biosynthesis protein [Sphingobacterium cellulitidis]|uniref:lipopolysaccharide biosynthesis protein n=1 Tax=Sphingobacterium cellulitidis TaxID=1768011 RepID=UPI00370DD238
MSFIKQAKDGLVWTFLQQFSIQLINFLVQIVLARLLLPSDFGLIAMIAVFIAIGQSLSDSGMTSSLIRNNENTERDYGTVFITNLIISIFLYVVVFLLAPYISDFYNEPQLSDLLRVFSIVFIISSFTAVQIAKFSKELDFKSQFTFQLPSVVIGAFAGISMAFQGYGVWSIIGLNIIQNLSFALVLWTFYRWRPRFIFDKTRFFYHFDYGYKLTISGLINTVYSNLYKIIIGKKFSSANVGFFSQADSLRLFPVNQLSTVLNKVSFPLFASISEDNKRLKEAYISLLRLVLTITAGMMLVFVLVANPLFSLVFGDKWLPSVPYFKILCIASIFLPIGTYNLNILKVKGRSDLFLKVEVIKKIIGIISLIVCIPFGIKAIVWSLCLTNIFFAFLNGHFSGKVIDYPVISQIISSFKIIIFALIPFAFTYYLSVIFEFYRFNLYYQILIQVFLFLGLYVPLLLMWNKPLLRDIKLFLKK